MTEPRPCPECDAAVPMCECGVWECGLAEHLQYHCPSERGQAYRDKIARRKERKRRRAMSQLSIGIKPLADRVIVRPAVQKDKTDGGLYIPETAKGTPMTGTIVAVGSGRTAPNGDVIPLDVKYGDNVIYRQGAGDDLEHDGKKLLIMREGDLVAVLDQ